MKPKILFGTCDRCGWEDFELKKYKGDAYCPICLKLEKAEDEQEILDDKQEKEEQFRSDAGFENEMS